MTAEKMGKAPKRLRFAFAVGSVLFLAGLAVSPLKDLLREWKQYKSEYARFAESRPDTRVLLTDYHSGIDQIWIPALGVTDRCITCHQGITQPSLLDPSVPEPFRAHAPIPHGTKEWGCVVCHRGQGLATEVREAHETTKAWERPLLPVSFMQASCGVCHRAGIPEAPRLSRGRDLLVELNCVGCHRLQDIERPAMLGPDLTDVGTKVNRQWIYKWLKEPRTLKAWPEAASFSARTRQCLVAWIRSQPGSTSAAFSSASAEPASPIRAKAQPAARRTSRFGSARASRRAAADSLSPTRAEALHHVEPALALGLRQGGAELLGGALADGHQGHGGRLDQLLVEEQLPQRRGRLLVPGPLQLLAEIGLYGLGPVAAELGGERFGELAAGLLVLDNQDIIGQAVEGIVGLHVVALAGRDEHVDHAQDVLAAALVDFRDRLLDLLLVDVGVVHAPLIGIGHLVYERFQLGGWTHIDDPFSMVNVVR